MSEAETAESAGSSVMSTSSRLTRGLGVAVLLLTVTFLAFALVISPPEVSQGDSVRLFYLHVPSAVISLYLAFGITAFGGVMYLWKKSQFWDLVAWASAEVGVMFCGITLITGMLWGRPTWGTYWEWDPRLTSTAVTFILFIGYLALRRLDLSPTAISRRASVLGIISFFNVIIIKFSVEWWRGLHQTQTLNPIDVKIDGDLFTSVMLGSVLAFVTFVWLLVHRFRVAWLETQIMSSDLDEAIRERHLEASSIGGSND